VDHFWDESHHLSAPSQRADMERRLATAARHLGSPIYVLVVSRLHHETASALGARVFTERALEAGDGSNPVLLVISIADRAAAIETGKGNAGIVPEIDARRIIRSLSSDLSHGTLTQALPHAIAAIVDSADATAERRRPLPRNEDPPATLPFEPADPSHDGGELDDAGGEPVLARSPDQTDAEQSKGKPRGRSRVPIAAIIAGLLVLALAIRRRRNLAAAREASEAIPHRRFPPTRPPGSGRK
jgi:TPM domain